MKRNFLERLLYNGLNEEAGLREKARSSVLNSISIIGALILIAFTVIDTLNKDFLVALITGFTAFIIIITIIIVGITKKIIIGTTCISYIAFTFFALLVYTQGTEKAGYFWIMLFPLVSIFLLGIIHGTILTTIFGVLIYFLMFKIPGKEGLPVLASMAYRSLGAYLGVTFFTAAFEIIRMKAFSQLETTSNDLIEKRRQTTMILNNVKQGIFLLDDKLELADERSTYFNELFGIIENDQSFIDLIENKLPQRDFVATKDYLELFFNKTVNPTLLSSINPIDKVLMSFNISGAETNQVWLEFDFERIVLKNGNIQILGLFKDVTERVILEEQLIKEESESLRNMESLFQIIHVNPELMDEFLKDTNDEINKINELLKIETDDTAKVINHIFSLIHSIKGNAMLLGLNSLAIKLKDFEDYIKELRNSNPTWRELLKLTVNLAELKHDISQIDELIEKIISFQKKTGDDVKNRKYIFEESLKKSIDRLSKEYGKQVMLEISDYDNDIVPEKYRRLFKDSINQFIRNSFAHGIESAEQRKKLNKNLIATISISVKNIDNKIHLTFRDDGSGLNINKIKQSAIKIKGFTREKIDRLTNAEAVKLIFHPGFSTSDKIDNLSGQGVGMSVIKNHIESAGGKLNIKSSTGKFCEFRIVLQE